MRTLLTRQPIFASDERLVGYQILYSRRPPADRPGVDSPAIDGQVAIETLLHAGLEQVTQGHVAFLHVEPEMLLSGAIELIPPRGIVLIVDSSLRDPRAVAACERLRASGYRFAARVGAASDPADPALRWAQIVQIDVHAFPGGRLEQLAGELRPRRLHLLAQGVDNATARDLCLGLGFKMLQGYYFNQPEVVAQQDLKAEHLQTFRLLKEIGNPEVADAKIVEGFRRNLSLTYKLLRVVNSAAVGGQGIESIGHAVRVLGRESLYRWLSLLLLSSVAERGVNAEISSAALIRARLCEQIADLTGRPWATDANFVIGLFSRIDLLLGTTMEYVVDQTGFTDAVRDALLRRSGPDGVTLALVEAYEAGDWTEVEARCRELGIDSSELPKLYFGALPWAEKTGAAGRDEAPPAEATTARRRPSVVTESVIERRNPGWREWLTRAPVIRSLVASVRSA